MSTTLHPIPSKYGRFQIGKGTVTWTPNRRGVRLVARCAQASNQSEQDAGIALVKHVVERILEKGIRDWRRESKARA